MNLLRAQITGWCNTGPCRPETRASSNLIEQSSFQATMGLARAIAFIMETDKKVLPDEDAPELTVLDKILDAVITGVPDEAPKTEEQEKHLRELEQERS